jgi:hypothetical protein
MLQKLKLMSLLLLAISCANLARGSCPILQGQLTSWMAEQQQDVANSNQQNCQPSKLPIVENGNCQKVTTLKIEQWQLKNFVAKTPQKIYNSITDCF